jgi:prophage regulatory protein
MTHTRFLRLPEVLKRIALSKSQLYNLISIGEFPAQVKLGARASAWLESEITEWIDDRIRFSREGEL